MSLPVIGVTTYIGKNDQGYPIVALQTAYVNALIQAGAAPVLIPSGLTEEGRQTLFKNLDGILFTGGGDIALEYFDGEPHPRVDGIEKERDALEYAMLRAAAEEDKAFLGICRGFQMVNVALGGTLFTHIEDQKPGALKHDYYPDYPRNHLAHTIKVEAGTRLAEVLGQMDLSVNSLHHQGARIIPAGLKPAAYAPDGLVEGVELPDHRFGIAVQWHPEWLTDQVSTRRLFQAFVEAASNNR